MRNIVNIINFLRSPACQRDGGDILTPLYENIRILNELSLPSTFLLQYDVLENEEMVEQIKKAGDIFEVGGWLEVTQPFCEAAGEKWRGDFFWDYHPNVGFPIGYMPETRRRMMDVFMKRFREVFGYYPKSMGSWMIDAPTLDYLSEKYHIEAACICKEQCGTDGYNLWGGYYNQGYYPCRKNMLCPAQTKEQQINLPVFRMLGSDPIHQYDCGLIDENGEVNPSGWQQVVTLEPLYMNQGGGGGGDPKWVDWYLEQNFSGRDLGFSYTQAGQENSFGWRGVVNGLTDQYGKLRDAVRSGTLTVEKLCETGAWFSDTYELSPVCSMDFKEDWSSQKFSTLWYYSRYYRVNFLRRGDRLWIRDLQLFDENYPERYYNAVETGTSSTYDTLPVMDGYRFSKKGMRAGAYFVESDSGDAILFREISAEKQGNAEYRIKAETGFGDLRIRCLENSLIFKREKEFGIRFDGLEKIRKTEGDRLYLQHNGFCYVLVLESGKFSLCDSKLTVFSENGTVSFCFDQNR